MKTENLSPCTKCGKLIEYGWGSILSGVFVCEDCLKASPELLRRLAKKEDRERFKPGKNHD